MSGFKSRRVVRLKVKELAEQRGLSDLELAHRSGVDVRVVRRMMQNYQVNQLLLSQVVKVADALEVPTCVLFEDTERDE